MDADEHHGMLSNLCLTCDGDSGLGKRCGEFASPLVSNGSSARKPGTALRIILNC